MQSKLLNKRYLASKGQGPITNRNKPCAPHTLRRRENPLSAPFCFFRSNYNCDRSFVAFISAQIVIADTVRPHKFSIKRREQLGCSRLFFHSTVFDYIRCCILENIVENGRNFLPILANVVELRMIVAKEQNYFQLLTNRVTQSVPHLRNLNFEQIHFQIFGGNNEKKQVVENFCKKNF